MKYIKTFENFTTPTTPSFSDILFMVLKQCRMYGNFYTFEGSPVSNLFKTLEEDGEDLNKIIKRIHDIVVGNTKNVVIDGHTVKPSDWVYVLFYDIMILLKKHNHPELFMQLMGTEEESDKFRENLKHIFANVFFFYNRKNGQYFVKGKLTGLN